MENMITVLMIRPEEYPELAELKPTRAAFNQAVCISPEILSVAKARKLEDNIYVLYNSNQLFDVHWNRHVGADIIGGTFYIIATDDRWHPRSLTFEEIQKYMSMFWAPEYFSQEEAIEAKLDALLREIENI
jgi:hypothetical protein